MSADARAGAQNGDEFFILGFIVLLLAAPVVLIHYRTSILMHFQWILLPFAKALHYLSQFKLFQYVSSLCGCPPTAAQSLYYYLKANALTYNALLFAFHLIGCFLVLFTFPILLYIVWRLLKLNSQSPRKSPNFNSLRDMTRFFIKRRVTYARESLFTKATLSQTPLEFVSKNKIVQLKQGKVVSFDRYAAHNAYRKTLGGWYISKKFSNFQSESDYLLGLLPKEEQGATLNYLAASHAYETTAFIGLLSKVREHVRVNLNPLQHLRETHPALHYAIKSLGRSTAFAEGAGIISQFQAESARGSAQRTPDIGAAVNGLLLSLSRHMRERRQ